MKNVARWLNYNMAAGFAVAAFWLAPKDLQFEGFGLAAIAFAILFAGDLQK